MRSINDMTAEDCRELLTAALERTITYDDGILVTRYAVLQGWLEHVNYAPVRWRITDAGRAVARQLGIGGGAS